MVSWPMLTSRLYIRTKREHDILQNSESMSLTVSQSGEAPISDVMVKTFGR
jgi:hypothetical protein